ncbi:BTAD domain-containing putative transcriptional regulator [Kitasatospora sp. NPDC057541]|uniref:AfsR/SARP family transcriptional regulator n=1 Tax=unclassified Kitasatospora TaxID=2633591 RepID=UPI003690B7F5
MNAALTFRVLGPVGAYLNGQAVGIGGVKPRTVLASLLLAPGRTVHDARFSELLWETTPPRTQAAQLYTYISRLRSTLGSGVQIVRMHGAYQLRMSSASLDYDDFVDLSCRGVARLAVGEYEQAHALLSTAVEQWTGSALTNTTRCLADAELPGLTEEYLTAIENKTTAALGLGWHKRIVPELTRLVAEQPSREHLRAQLMATLYLCGRQSDALDVYHAGRRALSAGWGVDPGVELRRTYQAILEDRIPDIVHNGSAAGHPLAPH